MIRRWLSGCVRNWSVKLSVRQCQRLFRRLGFRQRKPCSLIAHADSLLEEAHKKLRKLATEADVDL